MAKKVAQSIGITKGNFRYAEPRLKLPHMRGLCFSNFPAIADGDATVYLVYSHAESQVI